VDTGFESQQQHKLQSLKFLMVLLRTPNRLLSVFSNDSYFVMYQLCYNQPLHTVAPAEGSSPP
jgi:hypothetical protein